MTFFKQHAYRTKIKATPTLTNYRSYKSQHDLRVRELCSHYNSLRIKLFSLTCVLITHETLKSTMFFSYVPLK